MWCIVFLMRIVVKLLGIVPAFLIYVIGATNAVETTTPILGPPTSADQIRLEKLYQWTYDTMDAQYIGLISSDQFIEFKKKYTAKYLHYVNAQTHQTEDYIHLGAGLLVNQLKANNDRFSTFVPPKKAKEFKEDTYAARADLGIQGEFNEQGYLIHLVQKHCEAFEKNIRQNDIILKINGESVLGLGIDEVQQLLNPEVGSFTQLEILFHDTLHTLLISLESKSYFTETVFFGGKSD